MPPKRSSVATPGLAGPSRIPRCKKARNESPDVPATSESSPTPQPGSPRHAASSAGIGSGFEQISSTVTRAEVMNAGSQEIGAIAHTSASNPVAATESKIASATKATASAPKSNTSDAATTNQSTPVTKDEGAGGDQPTSPGVNASSKRGAKRTKISGVEGAVFSPMAPVAINEIVKNHMNARIEASRFSIAEDMVHMDRLDKEIKKAESERATMEVLKETFKLFGRAKAEKILDFIFNESHKAIQKAEETAQELQLALSESRESVLKLEIRILELQREKLGKDRAE